MSNAKLCITGAALFAATLFCAYAAAQIFDPPAIKVSPVHDQIGVDSPLSNAIEDGRTLFAANFNTLDGAGRPHATGDSKPTPRLTAGPAFQRISGPDANSCFGCHNQPELGGSGDVAANVFFGAQFADPIVDSVRNDLSNERNTPSLFGAGALELAAREITYDLHKIRRAALQTAKAQGKSVTVDLQSKGIHFGSLTAASDGYIDFSKVYGIDTDLIVKPFGTKGVAISIREFTIAALNHHHGIQAIERFGWERTGIKDFDQDGKEVEFTEGQTTALVLFQALLPSPTQSYLGHSGYKLFQNSGCATCHMPRVHLISNIFTEPSSLNRPGSLTPSYVKHTVQMPLSIQRDANGYYIDAFTDFRRHNMCDLERNRLCNEELKQDNVPLDLFMTSRLWDLATSGPYCHRGDCATITEAIRAHGGEARSSANNFDALSDNDKRELVGFLLTLGSKVRH
jgi:Di-haem oxidoreductase, putative peroxidase